jgi:heme/copper-type cytochrome/quinol oxidase subunit 3
MEIPYIFTPRKDTGLVNSKIAIWLFLASEVMLFGGFFSSYVYLRLGADYPWPERALPVLPGLINTFILILSSVTVVFAWAGLKLRKWRQFQFFMAITIACAAIFMVLKAIEYSTKWHHQAVRLTDYTILEGHLDHKERNGKKVETDVINIEVEKITLSTLRYEKSWVRDILDQANAAKSAITLAGPLIIDGAEIPAGEPLSLELMGKIQKVHLAAKANNSAVRIPELERQWAIARKENPDKKGWELAPNINIDLKKIEKDLKAEIPTVVFNVSPKAEVYFKHRNVKEGAAQSKLLDDTVIDGKLIESPVGFHNLDAIDFRHVVMQAEKKGIEPDIAINNTWLIKNSEEAREAWYWNQEQTAKKAEELEKKYGVKAKTGKPNRVPTETERYRITWKDFVAKADGVDKGAQKIQFKEEFYGPNYEKRQEHHTFPHLKVPRDLVFLSGKFTPAWNTYYAIYFTMTFLHGLHVIGGALVLGYYLFFGRKMYLSNPEWLAGRVEVGGLFWHFVDLVWIFVFPIMYLM